MTTFIIHAENAPGTLFRVATIFLRRGINIETLHAEGDVLTLGVENDSLSVPIDTERAEKLAAQIRKIIGVEGVEF